MHLALMLCDGNVKALVNISVSEFLLNLFSLTLSKKES